MKGSLREKRPGAWELRAYAGADPVTGKKRQVSRIVHGSKRDATRALSELVSDVSRGAVTGGTLTLAQLIDQWFELARRDLSPTTVKTYSGAIDVWIKPHVGKVRLDRLSARHLDQLYRTMEGEGRSPSTIHQVHAVISRALRQGEKWDLVPSNVARKASPPRVRVAASKPPTPDEVRNLIRVADRRDPDLAAFLALSALTGARRGEMCGLRWSDVDVEGRTLSIVRSIAAVDGSTIVKSTKRGNGRRIALDDAALSVLEIHRTRVIDRAAAGDAAIPLDAYVFSKRLDGMSPLHPDTASRFFNSVRNEVGLAVRLHDLRHFAATELIGGGVDVRTVASRLGHADPAITLRVYSHVIEARDRDAAELIGSRLMQGVELGAASQAPALTEPPLHAGSAPTRSD